MVEDSIKLKTEKAMDTPRHQFTFDEQVHRMNIICAIHMMQEKAYGTQTSTFKSLDKFSTPELEAQQEGMRQIYNASIVEQAEAQQ